MFVDACAAGIVIPVRRPRRPFATPVVVVVDTRDTRSIRRRFMSFHVVLYSCARLQSHTRTLLTDDDGVDRFVDRVDVCASSNSCVVVVSSMGDPATRCVVVVVVVVSKVHSWWWFG